MNLGAQPAVVSGMGLAENAVYTILHPARLAELAATHKPAQLRETKRWVTAKRLFDDADRQGLETIVLYADAEKDCSKLIYWGTLTRVDVDASGTSYTVSNLAPLMRHRTQELVLRSTGANIADGYLRPYAVVHTPSFIPQPDKVSPTPSYAWARLPEDARTTLFSFGYWGAGSATPALVKAVNDAEALRGFEPPL